MGLIQGGIVVRFVVPGRPIPANRMTRRSKWSPRARRGLDYQEAVAWAARQAYSGQLHGRLQLSAIFVFDNRRHGDLSNLIKAIEDGIQYAGVVANDRQITRYRDCEIVYGRDPRVEVELRSIN